MDKNVSALYNLLQEKTESGVLLWTADGEGRALSVPVGSQMVRVSGLTLNKVGTLQNALDGVRGTVGPTIAIYDEGLDLIAIGGVDGPPTRNAMQNYANIEDISSSRLTILARALEERFSKPSAVKQLVDTLKAIG